MKMRLYDLRAAERAFLSTLFKMAQRDSDCFVNARGDRYTYVPAHSRTGRFNVFGAAGHVFDGVLIIESEGIDVR